jgi:hypothetical protein
LKPPLHGRETLFELDRLLRIHAREHLAYLFARRQIGIRDTQAGGSLDKVCLEAVIAKTRQSLFYRPLKVEQQQHPAIPQLPDLGRRDVEVARTHPRRRQAQDLHALRAQVSHRTFEVGVRDGNLGRAFASIRVSATDDKARQSDKAQRMLP